MTERTPAVFCAILMGLTGFVALAAAKAVDAPVVASDWRYGACFDRGYIFPARAGSFSGPMCYTEDRKFGYPLPGCEGPSGPLVMPNGMRAE